MPSEQKTAIAAMSESDLNRRVLFNLFLKNRVNILAPVVWFSFDRFAKFSGTLKKMQLISSL